MPQNTRTVSCRCLCGAVRFKADLKNHEVGACHCSMCRTWTGGVFLAMGYEGTLRIEDASKDALGVFQSSDWGERGFCKTCGTSLFWRDRVGGVGAVAAPSVENLDGVSLTTEIFYDDKPAYYNFAQETKKMTGAEVMAAYAPKAK